MKENCRIREAWLHLFVPVTSVYIKFNKTSASFNRVIILFLEQMLCGEYFYERAVLFICLSVIIRISSSLFSFIWTNNTLCKMI